MITNTVSNRNSNIRNSRIDRSAWLLLRILLVITIAAGSFLIRPGTAYAHDSYCTEHDLYKGKTYYAYVISEGIGAVGWTTYMNFSAFDNCDHGGLYDTVWTYAENITYKGGYLVVTSVQYQTSSGNEWVNLPGKFIGHYGVWNQFVYQQGMVSGLVSHIDMARGTRITLVRVNTGLYFNGIGFAPRSFTCSLITQVCW